MIAQLSGGLSNYIISRGNGLLNGWENQEDLPIHSVARTRLTDKRRASHVSWLFDTSDSLCRVGLLIMIDAHPSAVNSP